MKALSLIFFTLLGLDSMIRYGLHAQVLLNFHFYKQVSISLSRPTPGPHCFFFPDSDRLQKKNQSDPGAGQLFLFRFQSGWRGLFQKLPIGRVDLLRKASKLNFLVWKGLWTEATAVDVEMA